MASSYIKQAVDPATLKLIAQRVFEVFTRVNADVIVARGLSGSLVAAAVGAIYGAPFAIVRKPNEGSHSTERIEMSTDSARYARWIIVDDFIASGGTMRAIDMAVLAEEWGNCVGIVLYNESWNRGTFLLGDEEVPIFNIDLRPV